MIQIDLTLIVDLGFRRHFDNGAQQFDALTFANRPTVLGEARLDLIQYLNFLDRPRGRVTVHSSCQACGPRLWQSSS
jgi:hypothetical protein